MSDKNIDIEDEETADQIEILHRNMSMFVNGAPFLVLMGAMAMLVNEVIIDVSDNEEAAQKGAKAFYDTLKKTIEITYKEFKHREYMQ
jgi:methylthioribose-1-phosphate isomerase